MLFSFALVLAACSDEKGPGADADAVDTDTDTDVDTDTDADADADADTDADTDTDTDADTDTDTGVPPAAEDWTRDILATDLDLDLAGLTGAATLTLAGSTTSSAASFEVGDLVITDVTDGVGPLSWVQTGDQLDVGVPTSSTDVQLVVTYSFSDHSAFDGWMSGSGVTFLWPYFCGNLYPCKSGPAEGSTFTMAVSGATATAVFPASIPADAPSYMPAIAVGAYTETALGTTTAGTDVSVWTLGNPAPGILGTADLVAVVDFFEQTYGPYTFGSHVGSVQAQWGPGAFGGMEHHPYWHVAGVSMSDPETHAHEAAHGWFGNGVRPQCWEDFVLSEGVASYISVHALEMVGGPNNWTAYGDWLDGICGGYGGTTVTMPPTCGAIDILYDPLWSGVPYVKGACFLEDVGDLIGIPELDAVLASFYQANVGSAAEMEALIDALKVAYPADAAAIDAMVVDWLTNAACPIDAAARCSAHVPY